MAGTILRVNGLCPCRPCIITADVLKSLRVRDKSYTIRSRGYEFQFENGVAIEWLLRIKSTFTPDQYFWYIYWQNRLADECRYDLPAKKLTGRLTITLGKCIISDICIVYDGCTIYHYHQVSLDEYGVYINAYRYPLSNRQLIILVAISLAYSPAAMNLIY